MNKRIGLLGGILSVQVLILAVVLISNGLGADEETAGLLLFEPARVARLGIATADEAVELSRGDTGWRLDGGLPADDGKVGDVLEKIAKVSAAWPVATSAESAERFEVTEENFQRRLVIESEDGASSTLYLGSSPGYRRVHARAADADEVYSIDFSNYEAPADADHWLDKQLLRPGGEVVGVARAEGWALRLADGEKQAASATAFTSGSATESLEEADDPVPAAQADPAAADDAISDGSETDAATSGGLVDDGTGGDDASVWMVDGAPADKEAAERLVGRFADLSVLGIAEEAGEPKGSFDIQTTDGEYRLDLFFDEEEDDYSVISSRIDGRFEIATYIAEQMLIDADDLLPEPEESEGEAEDEAVERTTPDA